jgi:uncharacterized membrane protein YfcA
MSFFIIPITAFIASVLTFFSGFGLGTILLPLFTIYYDALTAVAMTAIVHFLNNIFKISLVYKSINWPIVIRFGFPSLCFALIGAFILKFLSGYQITLMEYTIFNFHTHVTLFQLLIGLLIILFSFFELIPVLKNFTFNRKQLFIGSAVSGFFGGLSGHQGALRSAFLIKLNLEKESFIATGTAIACVVDLARISIYAFSFNAVIIQNHYKLILIAVLAAFAGALLGNKLLKKITLNSMKWIVTIFMMSIGLLMMFGIIN